MATKKSTTKPNSRTSSKNSSQLTQFTFRWWMALILIGVVAILGIIIVRFSHAGTQFDQGNPSYVNDSFCVNGQVTYNGHVCVKSSTSFKGF